MKPIQQDKRLRKDYAQASEHAFGEVWNNDDDAAYDKETSNSPASEKIARARSLRALLKPQSFSAHEIDFLKRDR